MGSCELCGFPHGVLALRGRVFLWILYRFLVKPGFPLDTLLSRFASPQTGFCSGLSRTENRASFFVLRKRKPMLSFSPLSFNPSNNRHMCKRTQNPSSCCSPRHKSTAIPGPCGSVGHCTKQIWILAWSHDENSLQRCFLLMGAQVQKGCLSFYGKITQGSKPLDFQLR